VWRQHEERGLVAGIVSLGDPAADGDLVDRFRRIPLVRSLRARLAAGPVEGIQSESTLLDQPAVMEHFNLLARPDPAATIEATSDQLGVAARLARELPQLKIVVDHFDWPTDLGDAPRRIHLDRHAQLAATPNVATRLNAIGTIFGEWTAERARLGHSRRSLRSRPVHARFRSIGRAPALRFRTPVSHLRRDLRRHTPGDRERLLQVTAEQ
jgi:predicted TIM-barrel fold metal-dependent hydrolase